MKNNIILCGFMGCGKSTVGKRLAQRLNYTFVDTDSLIENKENMSVSAIFSEKGEQYFRNIESEVAKELSGKEGLVIATGGGMMLCEKNAENLNKTGLCFWLKVTSKTVLKRLKDDTSRPLLQRADKETAIKELMEIREPIYKAVCQYHVNGECDSEKVASDILTIVTATNPIT